MKCPKCGSSDVVVQAVVEHHVVDVRKRHGFLWWLCIGWWWAPIWFVVKWFFLTVPMIVIKVARNVLGMRPRDISNETKAKAVCQTCGHVWEP